MTATNLAQGARGASFQLAYDTSTDIPASPFLTPIRAAVLAVPIHAFGYNALGSLTTETDPLENGGQRLQRKTVGAFETK